MYYIHTLPCCPFIMRPVLFSTSASAFPWACLLYSQQQLGFGCHGSLICHSRSIGTSAFLPWTSNTRLQTMSTILLCYVSGKHIGLCKLLMILIMYGAIICIATVICVHCRVLEPALRTLLLLVQWDFSRLKLQYFKLLKMNTSKSVVRELHAFVGGPCQYRGNWTSVFLLPCTYWADSQTCVPRRAHNCYGDRCFATVGPSLWNSLPLQLPDSDFLYNRLKTILKTFLF